MTAAVPTKQRIAILNPSDTQAALFRLINEAERELVLVSPYVSLDKLRTLVRDMQGALAKRVRMRLVVRDKDFSNRNDDVLASTSLPQLLRAGMELLTLKDLHAKIYLSEKHALLTSLNLLESSINNSIEIGTWIPSGTPEYADVAMFLKTAVYPTAQTVTSLPTATVPEAPSKQAAPSRKSSAPAPLELNDIIATQGFCIRCSTSLTFRMDKPFCRDCFAIWNQYADKNYTEKFCHGCGEQKKTSFAKPLCRPCFSDQAKLSPVDDDDIEF